MSLRKLYILPVLAFLLSVFIACPSYSAAEDASNAGSIFETSVKIANSSTLLADKHTISLWGVEAIKSLDPVFDLNARTTLANAIGNKPVRCEVKQQNNTDIIAQCVNHNELDLGLFVIQQGFASVDRTTVFNTVFEDVYIQAEVQAKDNGVGIWSSAKPENSDLSGSALKGSAFLVFGFILFLLVVGIFTFLSIIIMRGFKNVIQAQNDNLDMMAKERRLRDKERAIVAVMLASELKANKSKIEAYLVVYDEILRSLKDPNRKPKYQTSGDIIQTQPALSRIVFERNTDKLDILKRELASDLVHFYARIKTQPEYINLEPDTPLPQAIDIVEQAVDKAKKLNVKVDHLLEDFENSGFMNETDEDHHEQSVSDLDLDLE